MSDTPVGPRAWVTSVKGFEFLIEAIHACEAVIMDLETTGLDEHAVTGGPTNGGVAARIVLASFTLPAHDSMAEPTTWLLPLSHPDSPFLGSWRDTMRQVAQTMLDTQRPLINHNVKFDARYTYATTGVDLSGLITWDTQLSSHLLDETRSTKLKERVPDTFGVERWDDFDLTYPGAAEDVPLFDLGEYAARDTYWTWRLAENHRKRMFLTGDGGEPDGVEEVTDARLGLVATWAAMPTTASLTRMEQRGILLDTEWTRAELKANLEGRDRLLAEMANRYGMDPAKATAAPTSKWFQAWTDTAVEAGDLRVGALTPRGKPQWAKSVLVRQARSGSEAAQLVLDQRGHAKRAEYLTSWLDLVAADGAIHSTYHAGRVVTGRLSSSNPNMQQVTAALKPAFIPRPGYALVDIDYSQIELRVAAFVSRCVPMIEAFRRGDDLHSLLAAQVVGISNRKENERAATEGTVDYVPLPTTITPDEVTKDQRQSGKSANFGLLYGMGPLGFIEYAETVYGVSFTYDEAVLIHEAFFDTWDGMRQWHSRQIARVNARGEVISPIGRVRRLPDIWDGSQKRASHAERNAINSPVQGFASDLMQMAAASISGLLPGDAPVSGAHIVATVHDSIVLEVEEDRWEEITRACQERMLNLNRVLARMDSELDVPLAAEAVVGTRWGLRDISVLG